MKEQITAEDIRQRHIDLELQWEELQDECKDIRLEMCDLFDAYWSLTHP